MLIPSHMVWGYVFGRTSSRLQKIKVNVPLLILAGALPDFDLFTRQPSGTLLGHHGISHSWLIIVLLSIPFFYRFGLQTLPYFLAVIQHPIFGDFVTNEVPLYFPLTLRQTGINLSLIFPAAAVGLEMLGFAIFLAMFHKCGDWKLPARDNYWNKVFLFLWLPGLGLTLAQSFLYYSPDPLTAIYSVYALASSLYLILAGTFIAKRNFLDSRKARN